MNSEVYDGSSLPPLRLPLFYFAFATLCFALALTGVIRYAQDFTQFYYHPRILALTHLVTLGWISGSILGALFLVFPMSLKLYLRAGRWDYFLFCLYVVGVAGMVSHFWIDRPSGMVWSAACVYVVFLSMAVKVIPALKHARAPGFVKMHLILAFLNILIAGGWGIMLGIHKVHGFLPTSSMPNVISHAHVAAIGWASMMVFGMGYRLLPMFIPGTPSGNRIPWISCTLMEMGLIGLFVSMLAGSSLVFCFAAMIVIGTCLFLIASIRTMLSRKPVPPPEPPKPDFAMLHVAVSFFWFLVASFCGLMLLSLEANEQSLRIAMVYGFLGLVGFLGQIVVGMKPKILSIVSWYYAFRRSGDNSSIPRPVDMPARIVLGISFALWTLAVPILGLGLCMGERLLVLSGGILLLAALVISVLQDAAILRVIWKNGDRKSTP